MSVYDTMFRYLTYDEEGNLTGCYFQTLQPAHEDCYIAYPDESIVWTWTNYRANATRDGIELIPPPEDPETV
jgi:hypothetical protein